MFTKFKNFIKNYIKYKLDKIIKEVYQDKIDLIKELQEELYQYSNYNCSNCGKEKTARFGGYYRDIKGHVFCSNECIKKFRINN